MMMHNLAQPRAIFTLWMALHGKLLTKDRLIRFDMLMDPKCEFCDHMENLNHLFFGCQSFMNIWKEILGWLGIKMNLLERNLEKEWLIKEKRKKGWKRQILKIASAETIYELWRGRNEKIFSHKNMNHSVKDKIIEDIIGRCKINRILNTHVNV